MLAQKFPQERAVAACLVRAIAADGQVRAVGERGKQRDQPLGTRLGHLAPVVARVLAPAPIRPRLGERPAHPFLARRQLRQPHVVKIAPRIVGLAHAARRATRRADAHALAPLTRAAEPYYAEAQTLFCALTMYCAPRNGAKVHPESGVSARFSASEAGSCSSFSGKKMKLQARLSILRRPALASARSSTHGRRGLATPDRRDPPSRRRQVR